jgi:hypothetical protein
VGYQLLHGQPQQSRGRTGGRVEDAPGLQELLLDLLGRVLEGERGLPGDGIDDLLVYPEGEVVTLLAGADGEDLSSSLFLVLRVLLQGYLVPVLVGEDTAVRAVEAFSLEPWRSILRFHIVS